MARDLLTANPAVPEGGSLSQSNSLLQEQTDWLREIAFELRKSPNADVLCSTVVHGTSQLSNAISDTNVHEVSFEVGGKPVSIYKLLAFSTYKAVDAGLPITLSILSLANSMDGFVVPAVSATVAPLFMAITIRSVWVKIPTLASTGTCAVNGPADATYGGLFLYGFTIPDYDRFRGSRSY
jgi:hypothetical protein